MTLAALRAGAGTATRRQSHAGQSRAALLKAAQAEAIGADDFVVSTDKKDIAAHAKTLDLILFSAPGYHNYVAYHPLLERRGYQIILGLHKGFAAALAVDALTGGRSRVKNSMIGGVANTQEIVELCAKHKIVPHVKVVPVYELNNIFSKLNSNNGRGDPLRARSASKERVRSIEGDTKLLGSLSTQAA